MCAVLVRPELPGEAFYWPGGPTGVLLVHGFTATSAEVRPLAHALHAAGYTVAGPLLPGHGSSPDDLNGRTWQEWVAAAEDVYLQLARHCQRVVIGGESMGGLIALYLASQHPEAAAVLVYAPAMRTPHNLWERALARTLGRWMAPLPKAASPPSPADARWQGYDRNPPGAAGQMFRLQNRVQYRLEAIHQPILIVQGRLDTSVLPDVPERIARSVSSDIKEIHWMAESGHCVILDGELEAVFGLTLAFLQRALAPAAAQLAKA